MTELTGILVFFFFLTDWLYLSNAFISSNGWTNILPQSFQIGDIMIFLKKIHAISSGKALISQKREKK